MINYLRQTPLLFGAFIDYLNVVIGLIVFPAFFVYHVQSGVVEAYMPTKETFVGLVLACYYAGLFLGAPFLGGLSDYHGRKKLLYVAMVGTLIALVMTALSMDYGYSSLLFVSRFVSGFFAANIALAQSSFSDVTTDKSTKAGSMSLVEVAIGCGIILGGVLGGFLSNKQYFNGFSYSMPYWILAVCLILNLIFMSLVYKDTLREKKPGKASMLEGFLRVFQALSHQTLRNLFIMFAFCLVGWALCTQFFSLFLIKKFSYSVSQIGTVFIYGGIIYLLAQIAFVVPLSRFVRPSNVIYVSLFCMMAPILSLLFSTYTTILYSGLIIYGVALATTFPNVIALISNKAPATDQGEVIGMIWSVQALMAVVGTLLGSLFVAFNYQLPIAVGVLFFLVSWLIYFFSKK